MPILTHIHNDSSSSLKISATDRGRFPREGSADILSSTQERIEIDVRISPRNITKAQEYFIEKSIIMMKLANQRFNKT